MLTSEHKKKGVPSLKKIAKQKISDQIQKLNDRIIELDSVQRANSNLLEDVEEERLELDNVRKANLNLLEDIEEERKKAKNLADDLEKFKLAVDNVSDNIVITDPNGIVIYANNAVERVTGYTQREAIGKKSGTLWKLPMPIEYYEKLWDTISGQKKVFSGQIQNRRKDGEIYTASISISPILNKNKDIEFFVGVEHDITKEKEIDRLKSDFISIASHQLRTPLTGIQWVVERFTKKENLSLKGKEYLNDVHMSARRLTELVDLLLNLSRIEAGRVLVRPESLEIVGFIKHFLDEVTPLQDKKELKIVFTNHPSELFVKTDKIALHNIVQNLISNAIEYTPKMGRIEVIVKKNDGTFTIKVQDTGIGIPKSEQIYIFQKFVRASNAKLYKTDGTGIGLYISERATYSLGGKIWFESEENKGSTFYVELPLESQPKGREMPLTS
ncbi:MAG: ATP-binding protein [Candidatus Paceibacterota bacterium]|jgi:PAS domain S-box-containing protein